MSVPLPLSILDLATVRDGETIREGLEASVAFAQRAEEWGFRRIWYAEHHNMRAVASSATSVLIAHVAAHTERITLGSGGVMLPNHSPLVIAEQFGTLASLHPGRIELGLGRAPGTDQATVSALRRDPGAADRFPQDVQELQAFLSDESLIPGVHAYPGRGTNVPVTILGSSLYGARVAAALGLPYAFASHFAPDALEQAVALYRKEFRPSAQLAAPHAMAAVNVVVADSADEAAEALHAVQRDRVKRFLSRGGHDLTDEEAEILLEAPAGQQIRAMTRYTAAGTPDVVVKYLDDFARRADADELIVTFPVVDRAAWFRSAELLVEQVRPARV
ncbi:luciferase family oxidoreductase group 1 [Pseudonocardia hierapolitana]|uniref:Luciferase family oxidoreductase group 1 n=1 Tax=Pseudonocardia hierapolitana TaxID=1128676 RepID=A0A561SVN6_9PSEU|nr:LLM class flavin-dependent oxidoreductase [Pseudonocardia hierapolitana]TWF78922.1 luciferase family oxidoreductase group 1 [Pseudonocardia hierapolitana]